MRPLAFAFLALLFAGTALPAVAADAFQIPPMPDHFVTDNAGALSESTRTAIESELKAYQDSTGHQIVVWIGKTTGSVPLETWTVDTANRWKAGRKGKDDGAALFLFMDDHKVRIEVGYGLEGKLTDADAHRIITDEIVPRMKAGDADGAITAGVAGMLSTITPDYKTATPAPAAATPASFSDYLIFLVIALIFLFVIFMIVMKVLGVIRYGYLVMREGPQKAGKDMSRWWFWGLGSGLVSSSGGWSSGGGGGGGGFSGFSGGGGSFGGGGASGGW